MQLTRALRLTVLVLAAVPAAPAAAEIHKCRAADGKLVFSQMPCAPDAKSEAIKGTISGYSSSGQAEAYGNYLQQSAASRAGQAEARAQRRQREAADARKSARSERAPPANADERRIRDAEMNRSGSFYMQPASPIY